MPIVYPPRPADDEVPTFKTAKRLAPVVMRRLRVQHILVWTLLADDSIELVKFNLNGSKKIMTTFGNRK